MPFWWKGYKIVITIYINREKSQKKRAIEEGLIFFFENMLTDRIATYEGKNKILARKRKIGNEE